MAITSQMHTPSSLGEVQVGQWQAANLLKPSAIKPVFATLNRISSSKGSAF
jgi:mRNA interferase MazF